MRIRLNQAAKGGIGLGILLSLLISIAVIALFIKNFSETLGGGGDVDIWGYLGFYFAKNLSFIPWPSLNLVNNQVFYPYGTNSVFQAWASERDLLYAALYLLFGNGPWLQFYYLYTVLITAVGTYVLLVWDYGVTRAFAAGFLVSLGNFYVMNTYPNMGMTHHWTTLNIIADFLIVKRVTLRQELSLRLVLLRIALLALSLGQPLGYVAAFALLSFTISVSFTILILIHQYFKRDFTAKKSISRVVERYKTEAFTHPHQFLVLLSLDIIASYLYFPLALQIVRNAKSFDFTGVTIGAWWANPFRLLIPYLPGFNPKLSMFDHLFHDSPELAGAGSIGWFLLIIGTVGLWQSRRQLISFIPLIVVLGLCISYHPIHFPILKIFPWFSFDRVAGRSTAIYPVIFCLFALEINFNGLRSQTRKLLSILLVCLACIEVCTAYYPWLNYQPYSYDQNFSAYMNYVKTQPGEAVLDWPFCIVGGNGVGGPELCPFLHLNLSIFTLRKFHEKKVMGQYSGRLHPSQMEAYLQAGWNKLFFPDSPDVLKANHQTRCFKTDEWSFFDNFYRFNDFAGINLYVDLLPGGCITEFYQHFGMPVVKTLVPGAGKVEFIPKATKLRSQVNPSLGLSLKFEPTLKLSEYNLLQNNSHFNITTSGLSAVEESKPDVKLRWALGPATKLAFNLAKAQPVELIFGFTNPIRNQNVIVEVNGVTREKITNITEGKDMEHNIKFQGIKGRNEIVFKYSKWNRSEVTFAPNDDRPMAILFNKLSLIAE